MIIHLKLPRLLPQAVYVVYGTRVHTFVIITAVCIQRQSTGSFEPDVTWRQIALQP